MIYHTCMVWQTARPWDHSLGDAAFGAHWIPVEPGWRWNPEDASARVRGVVQRRSHDIFWGPNKVYLGGVAHMKRMGFFIFLGFLAIFCVWCVVFWWLCIIFAVGYLIFGCLFLWMGNELGKTSKQPWKHSVIVYHFFWQRDGWF